MFWHQRLGEMLMTSVRCGQRPSSSLMSLVWWAQPSFRPCLGALNRVGQDVAVCVPQARQRAECAGVMQCWQLLICSVRGYRHELHVLATDRLTRPSLKATIGVDARGERTRECVSWHPGRGPVSE
jgi:hypothetical protein